MPVATPEPASGTEETKPWALRELPVFPPITTKLLQLLSNDEAQIHKLVELLRSDAAFTAEVLRRANSPLYGLRAQVSGLQQAVLLLGFDQMRSLAMAISMGSYLKPAMRIAALRRCWRHSIATAILCEEIAKAMRIETDRAYTAGILHDIGLLGLMVNYPNEYANLLVVTDENSFDLRLVERAQFDVDHCEAGAWLAKQWNFPEEIQNAARYHHDEPKPGDASLTSIVYWASLIADLLGFHLTGQPNPFPYAELRSQLPGRASTGLPEDEKELREKIAVKVDALE